MRSLLKTMENSDFHEIKQTIYNHWEGFDKSYPKMLYFIEFEPLCSNLMGIYVNFALFYNDHSPVMVKSHNSCRKFQEFLILA